MCCWPFLFMTTALFKVYSATFRCWHTHIHTLYTQGWYHINCIRVYNTWTTLHVHDVWTYRQLMFTEVKSCHNYSVIRWQFVLPKLLLIRKSVLCDSATKWIFLFQNNLKNLYPSYKMNLDFWGCEGWETLASYIWQKDVSTPKETTSTWIYMTSLERFSWKESGEQSLFWK